MPVIKTAKSFVSTPYTNVLMANVDARKWSSPLDVILKPHKKKEKKKRNVHENDSLKSLGTNKLFLFLL